MELMNNSAKIIGIEKTTILPGKTVPCPKGYENNPVIKRYIENGTLTAIESDKGSKKPSTGSQNTNDQNTGSQSTGSQNPGNPDTDKKLEEMTEDELLSYAEAHNIDVGKASSREGILKKIQEAQ